MNNQEKKERIIEAAGAIFSQKGFHQAKMDEIAAMAGVAKGTLYYNYASKSKLFAATVTQGLSRIMAAIEENLESDLPFHAHFRDLVATLIRLYVSNSEVTRIYANELSSGIAPEVIDEIKTVRKRFNACVETSLKYGQDKGYITPLPPHLLALSVIGLVDTLSSHFLEDPGHDSLEEIIDTVVIILTQGMVSAVRTGDPPL